MPKFTGVVIFERTDFDNVVGNRFESSPQVFVTEPYATYGEARNAATDLAQERLREGIDNLFGMGQTNLDSMKAAVERIFAYNNATYSFALPGGDEGQFLVRWAVADRD